MDDLLILCHVAVLVDKRQLKMNCAVKVIQEITPVFKDGVLIFILCQLIVDVIKTDRLGIKLVLHPADTVPSHLMVWNRLLCSDPLISGTIRCFLSCPTAFRSGNHFSCRTLPRRCCDRSALFLFCVFLCVTHCLLFCSGCQLCFPFCIFLIRFFMFLMQFFFIFLCPFEGFLFPACQFPVRSADTSLPFQCFIPCHYRLIMQSAAYWFSFHCGVWKFFFSILLIQPVIIRI